MATQVLIRYHTANFDQKLRRYGLSPTLVTARCPNSLAGPLLSALQLPTSTQQGAR